MRFSSNDLPTTHRRVRSAPNVVGLVGPEASLEPDFNRGGLREKIVLVGNGPISSSQRAEINTGNPFKLV